MERLRTPIALLLAAALLPVVLLASPFLLLWARAQWRGRARFGHRVLWPFMRKTLVAYAEAWITMRPPPGGWDAYLANIDRYLAGIDSPRAWLQPVFVGVMEIGPLFTLRRRFSRLSLAARRFLFTRYYLVPGSLLAPLGWSRQIVRMGYHAIPDVASESGFIAYEVWSAGAKAPGAPGERAAGPEPVEGANGHAPGGGSASAAAVEEAARA
jgi:hypothetical protein